MKPHEQQGNGTDTTVAENFTTQLIADNPYLQGNHEVEHPTEDKETNVDDEFGPPIESVKTDAQVKKRRRRLALLVLVSLLFLCIVVGLVLYRAMPTRIDYGRTRPIDVLPPAPTANSAGSRDSRTEKAIQEAERLTGQQPKATAETARSQVESKQLQESPFTFPTSSTPPNLNTTSEQSKEGNVTNETTTAGVGSSDARPSSPSAIRSQRSSETSLYMAEPTLDHPVITTMSKPLTVKPETLKPKLEAVTLPTFASMLPVQTIGALYTLRTGALVRMQLTRDVMRDGWSMKRGTVLVGSAKGSNFDRAYVSLLGFIDPKTNKLVKLGGDLLGGDGAEGLKGKRRQINAGWTRVLNRVASSAVDITSALLSGRNRDTVIISDGSRTRTVNPITEEISGVLGANSEGDQSRSFVEVVAGTPGYILVTDLPSVIEGTEPNGETLAMSSDADVSGTATGLSERELADLLATGSPEQIRAAMPRMSPEMRKLAEAVLRP